MKKFAFFAAALAAVSVLFTACPPEPPTPPTNIVYDGFYVIGEATNVPTLTSERFATFEGDIFLVETITKFVVL